MEKMLRHIKVALPEITEAQAKKLLAPGPMEERLPGKTYSLAMGRRISKGLE